MIGRRRFAATEPECIGDTIAGVDEKVPTGAFSLFHHKYWR